MKVLFLASEFAPLVKVGGLGDVASSLPLALKKEGVDISVILPFYKPIKKENVVLVKRGVKINFAGKKTSFNVFKTHLDNLDVFLIEEKKYISSGGIYIESDASSGGSFLELKRFLFFSLASIELAKIKEASILHCNDWHVAIVPWLVKKEGLPFRTLLTIHNLGYQGIYPASFFKKLLKIKVKGKVNCLELGIQNADIINTVSPSYAKEILTKNFGFGLEKTLRKRKKDLYGILNGLDENIWNPKKDKFIVKNYSLKNLAQKQTNKLFLQKKFFQKTNPTTPLLCLISRLAQQKGIDLLIEIFPKLLKKNLQFILLGKGSPEYENFFKKMEKQYPTKFRANILFDEKLAHHLYAGGDIFLMPSYFEPCGLGQQISMKYGTVPVARKVGGIKDTIREVKIKKKNDKFFIEGEGFLFQNYTPRAFWMAINRSLKLYQDKTLWRAIQKNGMKKDVSWKKSAKEYLKLYQRLL